MNIDSFRRVGPKLLAQVSLDAGNSVEIEVERTVDGKVVKNDEAYAKFSREIADYKAGQPA